MNIDADPHHHPSHGHPYGPSGSHADPAPAPRSGPRVLPHTDASRPTDPQVAALGEVVWEATLRCDERTACGALLKALDDGLDPERVLLDVIAPVQRRMGGEWVANRVSVAQEHATTAINERVVTAVAQHAASRVRPTLGRVTVACMEGEWHAMPARLLAETLKLRGWRVDYLGAQLPTPHLIRYLHDTGPDAVALSASLATRLPVAHTAVAACHSIGVPVLVGGAAFGADGRYARATGADAWASDARDAARLLAGQPLPSPRREHQPIEDLPHLADQEYTYLRGPRPDPDRRLGDGRAGGRVPGDAFLRRPAARPDRRGPPAHRRLPPCRPPWTSSPANSTSSRAPPASCAPPPAVCQVSGPETPDPYEGRPSPVSPASGARLRRPARARPMVPPRRARRPPPRRRPRRRSPRPGPVRRCGAP